MHRPNFPILDIGSWWKSGTNEVAVALLISDRSLPSDASAGRRRTLHPEQTN
jgi:hypothetical protein